MQKVLPATQIQEILEHLEKYQTLLKKNEALIKKIKEQKERYENDYEDYEKEKAERDLNSLINT